MLTGYSQGGEGFLGITITWRPGDTTDDTRFVAPTDFVIAEAKGLDQIFAHIEHQAAVGSRDTDKGHRTGKAKGMGPVTFALYPTNAHDIWEAGMGFKTTLSALSSDTTIAIVTGAGPAPTGPVTTTPSSSGGTLTAHTYKYVFTDVSPSGETLQSAANAGDTTTGSASSIAVAAITAGPLGTTARNVYRKTDTGPYGLVHTIADNTTTTWTDTGAVQGDPPPTSSNTGISALTLTTGDTGYTALSAGGRLVLVDTGVKQELRPVMFYDATNKILYLPALSLGIGSGALQHTSSGTTVVSPIQDLTRPIVDTDFAQPSSNLLPKIAVEDNKGGKFSYQYRDGLVGKLNIKGNGTKISIVADLAFSQDRQLANGQSGNPTPTAFDDTIADLNDLSFEFTDMALFMQWDPFSTGVSIIQRMNDMVDFELDINNNLKEEACADLTSVFRHLPGAKREFILKMKLLNNPNRHVIYEDFVKRNLDGVWCGFFVLNTGTVPASPAFKGRSFYSPHVRYITSKSIDGITETIGEDVEARLRRASGSEKLYIYSIV